MAELSEHRFLLLAALAKGPAQGHDLRADVLEFTGGRVRSKTVSTIHALDALVGCHLVAAEDRAELSNRSGRWYRLTEAGRARLQQEAERHRSLATLADEHLAQQQLATPNPGP